MEVSFEALLREVNQVLMGIRAASKDGVKNFEAISKNTSISLLQLIYNGAEEAAQAVERLFITAFSLSNIIYQALAENHNSRRNVPLIEIDISDDLYVVGDQRRLLNYFTELFKIVFKDLAEQEGVTLYIEAINNSDSGNIEITLTDPILRASPGLLQLKTLIEKTENGNRPGLVLRTDKKYLKELLMPIDFKNYNYPYISWGIVSDRTFYASDKAKTGRWPKPQLSKPHAQALDILEGELAKTRRWPNPQLSKPHAQALDILEGELANILAGFTNLALRFFQDKGRTGFMTIIHAFYNETNQLIGLHSTLIDLLSESSNNGDNVQHLLNQLQIYLETVKRFQNKFAFLNPVITEYGERALFLTNQIIELVSPKDISNKYLYADNLRYFDQSL